MRRVFTREEFALKLGADGDPKLNAAADFTARLLNGPAGDRVARIVLFGSVARGESDQWSDVDLLVIGTGNMTAIGEQSSEVAYDITVETGELVSPLVYSVMEAEYPATWFLHNALKLGREVFRMDDAALRRKEAESWWALAQEYLHQARRAGEGGSLRLAVDGAYNAAELAVKGMLALRVQRMPSSHGGLLQIFSREYVATGEVDRMISHRLSVALDLRGKARYNWDAEITLHNLSHVEAIAQDLIDLLGKTLSAWERQSDGNSD